MILKFFVKYRVISLLRFSGIHSDFSCFLNRLNRINRKREGRNLPFHNTDREKTSAEQTLGDLLSGLAPGSHGQNNRGRTSHNIAASEDVRNGRFARLFIDDDVAALVEFESRRRFKQRL